MGYRDELDAARHRTDQAERSLADAQEKLALQARELAALKQLVHQPPSGPGAIQTIASHRPSHTRHPQNAFALYLALALSALALLVIGAIAVTGSERDAVAIALLCSPMPGALLGVAMAKRLHGWALVFAMLFGAASSFFAVGVFFHVVWPLL
ncbi:MAG: hypothetical protein Q8Q09_04200 [Deltaproteobacteria bacterium]|nr:hypothetical protein [Deltaproteobacteria bacterium]